MRLEAAEAGGTTRPSARGALTNLSYRIDLPSRVEKALGGLEKGVYRLVEKAIDSLAKNPRPPACKKLGGSFYRLRIRKWRVVYAVFDKEKLVQLIRLVRRSERTYKNL